MQENTITFKVSIYKFELRNCLRCLNSLMRLDSYLNFMKGGKICIKYTDLL